MKKHPTRVEQLRLILKDRDRKSLIKMMYESVALSLKSRCLAGFYFSSFLYKKGANIWDHLSTRDMWHIQDLLCDPTAVDILHNKLFIHEFFKGRGVPLPRLIAHNFKERLFIENEGGWSSYNIGLDEEWQTTCQLISNRSRSKTLFVKPISESGGTGAGKFERPETAASEGLRRLLSGSYLIQDEVAQHPRLKELNGTSLNTVRIDTFRRAGTAAEIISALLRIGLAGSHVDNIAAGGLFVGIDLASGKLQKVAFNKLSKGAVAFEAHPDSNVVFQGFQLPFFDDVKRLVTNAANLLPPAIIGWDVAISDKGPILLEGNARYYDMQLSDIAFGGYRANPVFQKVLAHLHNKNEPSTNNGHH